MMPSMQAVFGSGFSTRVESNRSRARSVARSACARRALTARFPNEAAIIRLIGAVCWNSDQRPRQSGCPPEQPKSVAPMVTQHARKLYGDIVAIVSAGPAC
jgi:hypothetical protein